MAIRRCVCTPVAAGANISLTLPAWKPFQAPANQSVELVFQDLAPAKASESAACIPARAASAVSAARPFSANAVS